ncbi:MAG: hemerythrin family protein [Rhodospirillales bacterium]|nr:hemerythrin family protein [Rhodospirillales bacterium]MCW8862689.1 hemerythrin family protein [Rhodospirillales bacterium]MCW8970616.1 hemerythrin family protein [Rhodospirillales bacterium]MCW9002808.1 hemerythrin family protein [Rhodospirillales bacterium]MCW9040231.1 hemerythrin family protein [Rhodospirillales bacterium]
MADKPAIKIMEWSEKFIVDNGLIDNDHKFLIELINEFNENVPNFSTPEDMKPYLLSLKKYTQTHFAREERLQEAAQYNMRKEHRVEHRDMIAQLDRMIAKAETAEGGAVTDAAVEISTFLTDVWLVNHILVNDLPMRPFVDGMVEEAANLMDIRA